MPMFILQGKSSVQVWVRPISPQGSLAVAFLNLSIGGGPQKVSLTCEELGLNNVSGYNITETFSGHQLGLFKPHDYFSCFVNPSGVFLMTASLNA